MHASDVTNLLFKNLEFRSERQKVISANIANLNTPGYKTKDVSFEDSLKMENKNRDLELLTTNNNHIKPLNEEDSGFIFHEFLSILRKHSVSDKPNAFNKIFNFILNNFFSILGILCINFD